MLRISHPARSMPFHKDAHVCLGVFVKTRLVQNFGSQNQTQVHTKKMSSQLYLDENSRNLKMNLLSLTHAAHIYSTVGLAGNTQSGQLTQHETQESKGHKAIHPGRKSRMGPLPRFHHRRQWRGGFMHVPSGCTSETLLGLVYMI